MFFGMGTQRDPMADVRAFIERSQAARDRPMTPAELRSVIGAAFGTGRRSPGPRLVVTREDMDERFAPTKPPPAPEDPAIGRRIFEEKLRGSGGLNPAGYTPTERDEYVLARTMYAEAPNIPEDHQAIGWVTVNRARRPGFPSTVEDVVHQRGQYQIVKEGSGTGRDSDHWILFETPERMTSEQFRNREHAIRMAHAIMSGEIPDPTGGALFFRSPSVPSEYFDRSVAEKRLILAPYRSPSSDERRHLFYWRSKPGGIDQ